MYKYEKITMWIREQISSGSFSPGSKLPTEMELMEKFNVSRQSVRRAIQVLVDEGLVHSVQGSGIYAADRDNLHNSSNDRLARHNRRPPSRQIALVLTNYEDYIFPNKISGIYETLENAGYIINLFFTDNHSEKELHIFRSLLDGNYAGMLLDGTQSALPRLDEALFRQVIQKIPCIMMDSRYSGFRLPCVTLDDELGGYLATRHLIENGHRKIAYVGRSEYRQGIKRGLGYVKALMEAGIDIEGNRMIWYTLNTYPFLFKPPGNQTIVDILSTCTAITCYNDQVASDLIDVLEHHGLRIPADISIIGYDHATFPGKQRRLTTIEHPKALLGKKAAENLLRLIRDPLFDANYTFRPELVPGQTVRNLNAQDLASSF